MREREIILLFQYILNRQTDIESEIQELEQRCRFRRMSINDCIELMLAKHRLEVFRQTTSDIVYLLNLQKNVSFDDE